MNIDMLFPIVLVTVSISMPILALVSGYKRAKAKEKKDEAAAAWYGCIERICTAIFVVTFVAYIVIVQQDVMTTGFVKILIALERLQNG